MPSPGEWEVLFKATFGCDGDWSLQEFSSRFGIPRMILEIVYDRGLKVSGLGYGFGAIACGRERVYKFILIENGNALERFDMDQDQHEHVAYSKLHGTNW
jgi:hypothetical protein